MDPILQDKLLDLIVNISSIILGGGIILVIIEWSRHQREKRVWAREDQLMEIDVPRADMRVSNWQIAEDMSAEDKLFIYENQLEGTVKQLLIVSHFVIRNTTGAEIIVTNYDANILYISPGEDIKRFYDLETADLISVEDIGPIKLRPHGAIARILVIDSNFDKDRRLDTIPPTLVIEARTSSGATIHGTATLSVVTRIPDIDVYRKQVHPKKYIEKLKEEEGTIPF
jgi:hypothetical protein